MTSVACKLKQTGQGLLTIRHAHLSSLLHVAVWPANKNKLVKGCSPYTCTPQLLLIHAHTQVCGYGLSSGPTEVLSLWCRSCRWALNSQ